ncbi:O-antigen ligase family protein [Rossellomorea sp. BNER]|uniref:O-antigen ligase family protein n=1 Tax=Rossellomorea sp. BNER TaxID=2962031 RepID=UPI003AF2A826|nr:O-antigen ligase family protein [Rossellomorea sp. BNER]
MERLLNNKSTTWPIFLLLLFVTLSKYNLSIGFSLKIYMIFLAIVFCLYIQDFYIRKLYGYELLLVFFYFTYCLSGAFSKYPESSIRIILGVIIVLGSYFIMRFILEQVSIRDVELSIANVGLIFNVLSLLLYIIGLQVTGGSPTDKEITSFGLLLDRNYPRLIGLLEDPNIFLYYNTLFFCFYLTRLKGLKNSIGFLLCIITNLLTFSRGGLVALVLVVLIYIVLEDLPRKIKMLMVSLLCLILFYITSTFIQFDFDQIITSRFNDFLSDGGSGRFELWGLAIDYFISNPLIGIGAFNFSEYYAFKHSEHLYVHNTYLEILAESGITGFLMYISFLLALFIKLIRHKLYKLKTFVPLTLIAFAFQMLSLSLIINEAFFLFLAIAFKYLHEYERKELLKHTEKDFKG